MNLDYFDEEITKEEIERYKMLETLSEIEFDDNQAMIFYKLLKTPLETKEMYIEFDEMIKKELKRADVMLDEPDKIKAKKIYTHMIERFKYDNDLKEESKDPYLILKSVTREATCTGISTICAMMLEYSEITADVITRKLVPIDGKIIDHSYVEAEINCKPFRMDPTLGRKNAAEYFGIGQADLEHKFDPENILGKVDGNPKGMHIINTL